MWACIKRVFLANLPANLGWWALGILIGCIVAAIAALIPGGPAAIAVLVGCLTVAGVVLGGAALVALLDALIACF